MKNWLPPLAVNGHVKKKKTLPFSPVLRGQKLFLPIKDFLGGEKKQMI